MYKALKRLASQSVEKYRNKKVLMFDKKRYGLVHRPSFGYKILKFMTFPSLSDFRHGGKFEGNWAINRLFLGVFWKAKAVFIGIE